MTTRRGSEQLAFDLDSLLSSDRLEAAPTWTGAPLRFTTDYFSPADLDAAWEYWQFLHPGVVGGNAFSHMWHRAITEPAGVQVGDHQIDVFVADLRCSDSGHGSCSCVGDLLYRMVCEPCGWHTITAGSNRAVESWHDHGLPGWRDLPIVPAHLRSAPRLRAWVDQHYPARLRVPGAPIITERGDGGFRHVPGASPWGGYDLSHTSVDPAHRVRRLWTDERRRESLRTIDHDLSL